ncbi:sigma-54 dependent transcriptional regulator [Pseudodesulfovibrio sp. S3]|uniref:sigma-54-dependent transcriptional regulator n=1 Tax=unclassified Pseudodesulfovibrio TaxID=2661612 RepID=UPI000FEBA5B5|nr:sigma-54 dependent transcriptional regulator [Pseudodesulfovibrio sp. S3]MCJ2164421.1 sigma-54 dependent transcriptional regulator [Pseudodesulfovibrio sp. S3-i]RWU04627.1 sigma-54-dependent Fis family transcriptional regulator [Pseudodesulfovibrio sp. S3]
MPERILVVDDDRAFQGMLVEVLADKGYEVDTASTAEDGLKKAGASNFDLILHDIQLPGMSGLEALKHLTKVAPGVDVIVMTGYASKDSGVTAMQQGAYDYFEKPFSLREMEVVVRRALEKRRLQVELSELKRRGGTSPLNNIIGQSAPMMEVKERIARIAGLNADVLIMGETGTGKELVADTIHSLSSRAKAPFVKINCAAIPESLIESELFGHEKGAFTGATSMKQGKFELAEGGSLMLDEIGDMPLHLQPRLLRAVEQKQAGRVGGAKPIKYDVRIIAATNQELEQHVQQGKFRSDLYYRLNVATLILPPLRDRKSDLPQLAEFFLDRANRRLGTDIVAVSSEAMEIFYNYDWPGNVRQFANAVERAAIFCTSTRITPAEVDQAFSNTRPAADAGMTLPTGEGLPLKQALNQYEKMLIESSLRACGGTQTEAASALGVSAKNLWNKLKKHGINPVLFKN